MNRYEKYKPSIIDWVGEIPIHWEETKLKYIGYLYAGLTGKGGNDFKQIDDPKNKPFIPFTNIANNIKINPSKLEKVVMSEDDVNQNRVLKGDLFFMMSSENFDDVGKSTILLEDLGEVYLNSFCKGFRLTDNNVNPLFLNYLLHNDAYRKRMMIEANGFTRINLKMDKVNDFFVSLPPKGEQTNIANFLDEKTTQIEKLISNKQKLIELLKEERIAIINEAVSGKGKNWENRKLKYICSLLKDGTHLPPPRVESGIPLLSVRNLVNGGFIQFLDDDSRISEEDYLQLENVFKIKENDILLAIVGATMGKVSIVPTMTKFAIQRSVGIFRTKENVMLPLFLFYYFQSSSFQNILWNSTGFSAQPGIYLGSLSNFTSTCPSLKDQAAAVQYIQTETLHIDNTILKIEKEIELMNEYRTALISEVVTGKIDVRCVKVI